MCSSYDIRRIIVIHEECQITNILIQRPISEIALNSSGLGIDINQQKP